MKKKELTPEEKAIRKEENRQKKIETLHKLAPKRLNKYIKTGKNIISLGNYPLTDQERTDIITAVYRSADEIKNAIEKKTVAETLFKFSE